MLIWSETKMKQIFLSLTNFVEISAILEQFMNILRVNNKLGGHNLTQYGKINISVSYLFNSLKKILLSFPFEISQFLFSLSHPNSFYAMHALLNVFVDAIL